MKILEKGLPSNVDAERFVLGALFFPDQEHLLDLLTEAEFSLEKHRRIFAAMHAVRAAGFPLGRVAVGEELHRRGQLESVDGLHYLASLDEGMPQVFHLDSHIRILQNHAALRRMIVVGQDLVNRALCGDSHPQEIVDWATAAIQGAQPRSVAKDEPLTPGEVIERAGGPQAFAQPEKNTGGISTPWTRFNEMTGALRSGELIIVAGNPSMGKTAAAMQIGERAASAGDGVLVISLEMSKESLVQRLACQMARVDLHRFRTGYLRQEERTRIMYAIDALYRIPMHILGASCATVAALHTAVRYQKAHGGLSLVIIDYLQLMRVAGRTESKNHEVGEITRGLKLMAGEENVPVILLSQLNRENMREKRPPQLSDLRDSGNIEQDADLVVFVWRPEMMPHNRDREDLRGFAEFIIAKQRNGPVGKVPLVFLHHLTKFESRVEDLADAEVA